LAAIFGDGVARGGRGGGVVMWDIANAGPNPLHIGSAWCFSVPAKKIVGRVIFRFLAREMEKNAYRVDFYGYTRGPLEMLVMEFFGHSKPKNMSEGLV
jgi:hypothetical protein